MTVFLMVNSFPRISETFLFNLVVGLEQRGIQVHVLALGQSDDHTHFTARAGEWSGRVVTMPHSGLAWLTFGMRHFGRVHWLELTGVLFRKRGQTLANGWLSALIKKHQPHWVHFAYSGIGVQFLPTIEKFKHQMWMVSCRGSAEIVAPLIHPERAADLGRLFKGVTIIHCVSQHMVNTVARWGAPFEKTIINYPSVDAVRFRRTVPYPMLLDNGKIHIVSTGRLSFEKGYPYALLALQKLHQQGIDFQYHIIGEGEARAEITYLIATLGLQDRVFLLGKRSSEAVKAILEEAHLFLLTSLYEGVANAALEAMALEIPVLSTAAGGMAEVIQSGENGLLVECCNVPEIAQSIVTLIENPNRLKVLGQRGRATILNHHLIERQIDIFEQNYHARNQ